MARFVAEPTDLHLSRAERREVGRARRERVPRSAHAELSTSPDRADPVTLLAEQHTTRVQELVPIRWARMAQSPFAFLRGAALPMLEDLAGGATTGFTVQACGDAHLLNFGGFASPERREVFDLNDFDETLVGPWEWDVKRLAASIAVAAHDVGMDPDTGHGAMAAAVRAYRDSMIEASDRGVLEIWYHQVELERSVLPNLTGASRDAALAALEKMRRRTGQRLLPKLTELTDSGRRILERPPLVTRLGLTEADQDAVRTFWENYVATLPSERQVLLQRFSLVDVARKVVGVGSVGTRCFIALCIAPDDEALFLQIKEAPASVFERACGPATVSGGERVVSGQREIQAASDIFLGWSTINGHDFYIRQLRDMKYSLDVAAMSPQGFEVYARLCGSVLARAHARTGDPVALAGYIGTGEVFVDSIARWGAGYARQTNADHSRLAAAIADGEVHAHEGT
jgi:uncharacterized protein (DUF2252 family)